MFYQLHWKKENRIFRWDRVQSHIWGFRKDFLIYEEMHKYFHHIWREYDFAPDPSEFPNIYEENFILFFSVYRQLCKYSMLQFFKSESKCFISYSIYEKI